MGPILFSFLFARLLEAAGCLGFLEASHAMHEPLLPTFTAFSHQVDSTRESAAICDSGCPTSVPCQQMRLSQTCKVAESIG
ncbi:unnamed protein product [Protopolystoma xenopodis]|uniref:Secreted protein n=1 Tax=Protopolystoma xenopodis TaxID=117903 RepID=A0A448XI90_9PLAT|nr:unnamed protein product [Protopolystoma xenopodis]